jgi:DNA-binding response OmpR family regulator
MRILLIEDESEIATFLKAHLKMESFVVDVAEDGECGSYLLTFPH